MSQDPPHLTANLAVTSTSELMQLPGFTREIYLKLQAAHHCPAPVGAHHQCVHGGRLSCWMRCTR